MAEIESRGLNLADKSGMTSPTADDSDGQAILGGQTASRNHMRQCP